MFFIEHLLLELKILKIRINGVSFRYTLMLCTELKTNKMFH